MKVYIVFAAMQYYPSLDNVVQVCATQELAEQIATQPDVRQSDWVDVVAYDVVEGEPS